MGGDLGMWLQFGALGLLAAVLAAVGKGIVLWSKQSGDITTQVLGVISENSKVITSNTDAIKTVHDAIQGVRTDVRELSIQLAAQPCAAEELQRQLAEAKAKTAEALGVKVG